MAIKCIENMANKSSNDLHDITWSSLRLARRGNLSAFQLTLQDSKDILICHEVIRIMPGKRLVAFATWGNKAVVAKLFYEPSRAAHHARRDANGVNALQEAGILTPKLLFVGTAQNKHIKVIIFEKIINALSLADIWQLKTSIDEMSPLLSAVTIELATQHVLGVTQRDLHFKNFLIKKKNIYTLDGGDVSFQNVPLSKKESMDNLALFFVQLGVGTEQLQEKLFQTYVHARGWIVKKSDIAYLKTVFVKSFNKRWKNFQEKTQRSCTDFIRRQSSTSLKIYVRDYESPEFLQALKNPEIVLAAQASELLKAGKSSTVAEVIIDNHTMVIKRFNIKGLAHSFKRAFRPTRAAKAWRLGNLLTLVGIPTAKPIAFIEKRFLGLRGKSYLFMEYIAGVHAGEFFASDEQDSTMQLGVAKEIVLILENLAKLKITHGDLKMTNILISKNKPILIDLDGMREHKTSVGFKRAFKQEIKRFMHNWRNRPVVHKMFELLIEDMLQRLNFRL